MIQTNAPVDAEIHKAACIIARRFATMMAGVLRDDEKGDAEREGYRIAREVIQELAVFKGEK